jgi:DNA helicase HerA-like ATPase
LNFYRINSIPEHFDARAFIESLLGEAFFVIYNFEDMSVVLASETAGNLFDYSEVQESIAGEFTYLMAYPIYGAEKVVNAIYSKKISATFAFIPAGKNYIREVKKRAEGRLSRHGIRFTRSLGPHSGSMQMDLFYEYDERKMLESMVEMLSKATLENGRAYKFFIMARSSDFKDLCKLIEPSMFILDSGTLHFTSLEDAHKKLSETEGIPFSLDYASKLVAFPPFIRRLECVKTGFPAPGGDVEIGDFLEESIKRSGIKIKLNASAFNLGTLITGVPGTGKTFAAMGIVEQLKKLGAKVVVISPTKEWSNFATKNNIKLIRLYSSNDFKINFFKSDSSLPIEKFYEDLAMLLASASSAGPYRYSMEKSLLAAFHKVYKSNAPEPQEVYKEIEEAVIEQHAKRNNVGVKFSKHGENIMASLESLRLMLSRPEFSYKDGLDFKELINGSVVFDLSDVSNNMKQFFYALLLNQIYSIAEAFPEDGDDKLRLEIVLEEAQLVFGSDELSAPTLDLKERIQNFRKKGIGIMLITHSLVDVNQSIRRLCQNKLYFRQSPDMIRLAILDMGFDDEAGRRLKNLERGVCALAYMDQSKLPNGPFFAKVNKYELPQYEFRGNFSRKYYKNIRLKVGEAFNGRTAELYYLGEKISSSKIANGFLYFENLIKGKEYTLCLLGERKKDTITLKFKAEERDLDLSEKLALPK